MERAPTPTPASNNHETSDNPIYDQLMKEFMSNPDDSNATTFENNTPNQHADQNESISVMNVINALDENLSTATKDDNEKNSRSDLLALTPEESAVMLKLEGLKSLRIGVNEKMAVPIQNKVGNRIDSLRNVKDKTVRKALLLDHRESALLRDATRLEAKLAGLNPRSARYRRLNKKMGMKYIKLGETRNRIGRYAGAVENRSTIRNHINRGREIDNRVARDMLIVAKKVAYEKKLRRNLEKEIRRTITPERKEQFELQLSERIAQIGQMNKFKDKLMEEVVRRARSAQLQEG